MATHKTLDRNGNENIINSADDIAISSSGNGFNLTRAGGGSTNTVRFNEIDSSTNNPKLQIQINGVTVQTIDLNKNEIQINNAGSDFDLTDDKITFVETNGDTTGAISFAKYNISATTLTGGDVQISQNGSVIATISKNAVGIAFNPAGSDITSTNVQAAIEEVNAKIAGGAIERQDDLVATVGQTAFTLTATPVGIVNIARNGIILAKACLSVSGTTATYNPAQNGSNAMVAGDRVSFTYEG